MRFSQCLSSFLLGGALALGMSSAVAEAVDFTLPDLKGVNHKLSDYRGQWVVVNYWATWCPPCLEEIPDLIDFHERNKAKGIVVLGVNMEDIGMAQLRAFSDEYFISYPVLHTEPAMSTPLGPIPGMPTTVIVAPDGTPVARQVGPVTGDMLDKYIARKNAEFAAKKVTAETPAAVTPAVAQP